MKKAFGALLAMPFFAFKIASIYFAIKDPAIWILFAEDFLLILAVIGWILFKKPTRKIIN